MRHFIGQEGGMHLLELMSAVAISGLLLSAAIFAYGRLYRSRVLAQTAVELEQLFSFAESRAVLTAETIRIDFTAGHILLVRDATGATLRGGLRLPAAVHVTPRVAGHFGMEGNRSFRFYPGGTASPGTVLLRAGDNQCVLTQSLRGARRRSC